MFSMRAPSRKQRAGNGVPQVESQESEESGPDLTINQVRLVYYLVTAEALPEPPNWPAVEED